jgi:hypothetical protein
MVCTWVFARICEDFMESLDRFFLKSFVRAFLFFLLEGFFLKSLVRVFFLEGFLKILLEGFFKNPREGFFAVFCVFLGFFRVFVGAL